MFALYRTLQYLADSEKLFQIANDFIRRSVTWKASGPYHSRRKKILEEIYFHSFSPRQMSERTEEEKTRSQLMHQ